MERYRNFNFSSLNNDSTYSETNFGVWPHPSSKYSFKDAATFGVNPPDIVSAIFGEIFKSSIITLISLAGFTKIKPDRLKNNLIFFLENLVDFSVAIFFYAFLAIFLIPFAIYRLIIRTYFQLFHPSCSLMHGTDAFWCMDSKEAKSIINILILLDVKNKDENLLECLYNLMLKLCKDSVYGIKFRSYVKKSNTGYFYWEKGSLEHVKNKILYIQDEIKNENDLKIFLSSISNRPIDGFGWEVLICEKNLEESDLRAVVFRMHHSIGDGASILKALINTISDKSNTKLTPSQNFNISLHHRGTNFRFTVPTSEPCDVSINKLLDAIKSTLSKVPSFIYGPSNFIKQLFVENGKSELSVDRLKGDKIITWYTDGEILKHIKTIKNKMKCSFSEAVFGLVSNSIERHLENRGGAPDNISVVVPIFGEERSDLKISREIVRECNNIKVSRLSQHRRGMANAFWVALLNLPLKKCYSNSLKTKIKLVKESSDKFKSSPDLVMYKFMMSVIVTLVPGDLVKPMFNATKIHLVFSNLPGPNYEINVAGNALKQMAFWLPNRGSTGLGLSLLSNNGKLSIGLIADTAVVETHRDLQSILDHFVLSAKKECA